MKKKIGVVVIILLVIIIAFIVSTVLVPKLSYTKAIDNIIYHLGVKNKESVNFEANITSTGELYDVVNNSYLKGSYISDGSFILKADYTSNYKETINMNLYSKDNTYYYDPFFLDSSIILNNKIDLSINNFKNNIKKVLVQLKNVGLKDNNKISRKIIDGQNVISFNIYKDMFSNVELDYPYSNLFDTLFNYIDGSEVSIYTSLITGKLYRIEIKNDNYIEIVNDKNEYVIRFINEDNEVHKVSITDNKIEYTNSKGSTVLSSITINYTYDNNHNDIELFNLDNAVNINDIDSAKFKNGINVSKTKRELANIYYSLTSKVNIFDLYVSTNGYNVYYKLPDKYINKYTGKSLKRYVEIDKKLVYEAKNYTNSDVINYIDSIYNDEINKNYYKRVIKSSTNEIVHNDIKFNYQSIIKGFYYNYADYDDTKAALYVWTMLDDNNAFIIEYDYQGSEITEEEIVKLLDIEISK